MPRGPSLDVLVADAAGFGWCARCKFLVGGTSELCSACAQRAMEALAPVAARCGVCDRPLDGADECRNPVCKMSSRWFTRNHAISMLSGRLHEAIKAYKYPPYRRHWAAVFGRILVGYLDANRATFHEVDLIVSSPTYVGEGARRDWDHVREILRAANDEQEWVPVWPFDLDEPPAIVRTADAAQLVGMGYQARRTHAEQVIRPLLSVPDTRRTEGKKIAVFDDVFTNGLTLREIARTLRLDGGAQSVVGITLARQPWTGPRDAAAGQ